jgi:ribonuclease HII
MTIAQIEELARGWPAEEGAWWSLLEKDRRAGVRRLAVKQRKNLARQRAEEERREKLLHFERRCWEQGLKRVAGVDEAGRGCLAGPVVAAAVILPADCYLPGLDDSKKLSRTRREALYRQVMEQALAVGLGQAEAAEIDRLNIFQAALKAMRLAIGALNLAPDQVLVDGKAKPGSPFAEQAIIDGDARSLSIAAASVVAKVHRDRLMSRHAEQYPEYGFASHKGYGSAEHLAALRLHGPCPLHRLSFGPVAELVEKPRSELFLSFEEGLNNCSSRGELERMGHFIRQGAAALADQELAALRQLYRKRRAHLEDVGRKGEEEAARFLEARGYHILERGYRGAGGEVDLVVRQGEELVFVEVKTSLAASMGHPESRVRPIKRQRIIRAARHYLHHRTAGDAACRFDVVAVVLGQGAPEIVHLEDAFRA